MDPGLRRDDDLGAEQVRFILRKTLPVRHNTNKISFLELSIYVTLH